MEKTTELSQTVIGQMIADKMEEKGLSIKDLAVKLDITYEHVRRIVRGEGVPAKYSLRAICEILGISFREAERVATADKVRKKYGASYLEVQGKKPSLEPLERIWEALTNDQQKDIIVMAQGWVKRNKAVKA